MVKDAQPSKRVLRWSNLPPRVRERAVARLLAKRTVRKAPARERAGA